MNFKPETPYTIGYFLKIVSDFIKISTYCARWYANASFRFLRDNFPLKSSKVLYFHKDFLQLSLSFHSQLFYCFVIYEYNALGKTPDNGGVTLQADHYATYTLDINEAGRWDVNKK